MLVVTPCSHFLHQSFPLSLPEQLAHYYDFTLCGIWLFHLLRNTRICLRLSCAFWWPRCWASPHQPSHLDSGQTMMSTTDASYYHHCNNYSSGKELQCQLRILKSLPQHSELGSPTHLLNATTLSPPQASGSITWQDIAELYSYLLCSLVSRTLHSICSLGKIN